MDGAAVKACVLTTALAAGRNIVTVEGLPEDVREAFVYAFGAVGAVQCGFCIPGMVMAGAARWPLRCSAAKSRSTRT